MAAASIRLRAFSDNLAQAAGFDVRLLAMIGILVLIWLGFDILTVHGIFPTPWNGDAGRESVLVAGFLGVHVLRTHGSRWIDRLQQHHGADTDRPVLVREGALEHRRGVRGTVLREGGQRCSPRHIG